MDKLKKITNFLLISFIVGAVIYKYFVYVDFDNGCFIKIIPTYQPSNWDTKEIIRMLKNNSPEDYTYMCRKVKTINKNVGCGGFDGGCFYENQTDTIYIGNDQDNIALTAAVMVHEMCHLKQKDTGERMDEGPCYLAGSKYLEKVMVR